MQSIRIIADAPILSLYPPVTFGKSKPSPPTQPKFSEDRCPQKQACTYIAEYLAMAKSTTEDLSGKSKDIGPLQPKTLTRKDVVRISESSPREPYLSFNTGPHPLRRLIIKIWSHDQGQNSSFLSTDVHC